MNKGISQDILADMLNVSKNYISLIENNKKDPSISFLKKMSKHLDIPLILLVWNKIDLPAGKTKEEKIIKEQLTKMFEKAQQIYSKKILNYGK